jgi:hypothetical protein
MGQLVRPTEWDETTKLLAKAMKTRRFASLLELGDPARRNLLAYADELDARAANIMEGQHPGGAN